MEEYHLNTSLVFVDSSKFSIRKREVVPREVVPTLPLKSSAIECWISWGGLIGLIDKGWKM